MRSHFLPVLLAFLLCLCLAHAVAEDVAAPAPTLAPVAIGAASAETVPLAVFTPQPAATEAPASATTQTVTIRREGDVNVRREPRYNSDRVGIAKAGRTYALLDVADSGWYHIRLTDGTTGYVSPKLVQGEPEIATSRRVVVRRGGDVNVRAEANATSKKVGVAKGGRSYPLLATEENGWYRILLSGGVVGYISPKLVSRVTDEGENPDATPAPVVETTQTVTIRRQGNVNVRREPQYDSAKVGTATAGRSYPLLDTAENGWYHIRLTNGVEGYISDKLAK